MSIQKSAEQQQRCYDLLNRIAALQLEDIETNAQHQLAGYAHENASAIPENIGEEILHAKVVLKNVIKETTYISDNDTESSSEDECSDEEIVNIGARQVTHYIPVEDSPITKWAKQRADIVSSWTWLEDAISYVSSQIKQHEDIYKHMKATKVPFIFDEQPSSAMKASEDTNFIGGGLEKFALKIPTNLDPNCVAHRCIPVKPVRNRRLLRVSNLLRRTVDEKLCGCMGPCCCSDSDIIKRTVELMSSKGANAIAALNPAYHSSLSQLNEIPVVSLVDASLKSEGWKLKRLKNKPTTVLSITPRHRSGYERLVHNRNSLGEACEKKKGRGRPKLPRTIDATGQVVIDKSSIENRFKKTGFKTKIDRRASSGDVITRKNIIGGNEQTLTRRKYKSVSTSITKKRAAGSGKVDSDEQDGAEWYATPKLAGPGRPRLADPRRRKEQDYDIDNIVIPYSMASATRVPKIEYKDIVIPGWRTIELDNVENIDSNANENLKKSNTIVSDGDLEIEDTEDCRPESIEERHLPHQVKEHSRLIGININDLAASRRHRANSKTDFLDPTPNSPMVESMPDSPHTRAGKDGAALSALDATVAVSAVKVKPGRKRTVSLQAKLVEENDDDHLNIVNNGFELRQFPLNIEFTQALGAPSMW